MDITVNSIVRSKTTNMPIKVLAVVPKSTRKAESLVVVAETRRDSLGRLYRIPGTERIVLFDSLRRKYWN